MRTLRSRSRMWLLSPAIALMLLAAVASSARFAEAHNNPGFKEVHLLTIEVAAEPLTEDPFESYSETFSLELPKKTIELIWRVADGAGSDGKITFGVAQGETLHAEGLTDGANSRVLRGDDIRIVAVSGAAGPFTLEVYANVIDRSKPAES